MTVQLITEIEVQTTNLLQLFNLITIVDLGKRLKADE